MTDRFPKWHAGGIVDTPARNNKDTDPPYPIGTVLRATRTTRWGEDVSHGTVVAGFEPGGWMLMTKSKVAILGGSEWSFEVVEHVRPAWTHTPNVVLRCEDSRLIYQRDSRVTHDLWYIMGLPGPHPFPAEDGPFIRLVEEK